MSKSAGYRARYKARGSGRDRASAGGKISDAEYAIMLDDQAKRMAKNPGQLEALEAYQEESEDINNDMRIPWFNDYVYTTRESARKNQALLSEIAHATGLPKAANLYRGIDGAELARIAAVGEGNSFRSMGFTSTATARGSAEDYVKEDGAMVTIRAPKGTKGAVSNNYLQREVMIQRGTVFRVVSVKGKNVVLEVTKQISSPTQSVSPDL